MPRPIRIDVLPKVGTPDTFTVTITLDQTVTANTSIQFTTDHNAMFSGLTSTWPYQPTVASGNSAVSFDVPYTPPQVNTTVHFGAGDSSINMGSSANWQAATTKAVASVPT